MKNAIISSRTMILLIGAVLLCAIGLTGAIGATQASLNYSEDYAARIEQSELGVALFEKSGSGEAVAVNIGDEGFYTGKEEDRPSDSLKAKLLSQKNGDDLLILGGDEQMIPGKKYIEEISAKNVASMPQYLRITVKKYWSLGGNKVYNLDPKLIKLEMNKENWVCVEDDNGETVTFYYKGLLEPGEPTQNAINKIWLDPAVIEFKDQLMEVIKTGAIQALNDEDGLVVDTESLPQLSVTLEAQVEAVQTGHVADAAMSAWGVDITKIKDLGWVNAGSDEGQEA